MSASDPETFAPRPRRRKRRQRAAASDGPIVLSYGTAIRSRPALGGASAAVTAAAVLAAAGGGIYFVDGVERMGLGAAAVVLAVVSLVLQGADERFAHVSLDPESGVLTLTTSNGSPVELPRGTVARIECFRHVATSRSDGSGSTRVNERVTWKLALHKRDGGYLEALSFPEDEEEKAREAARALKRAMAGHDESPPAGPDATELLEVLRAAGAVEVATSARKSKGYRSAGAGEAVELSWGAPSAWRRVVAFLAAIVGMSLVFLGFAGAPGGHGAIIGAYFMGALGVLVTLAFASTLGVKVHVRVDDETLSVEKRRFGRPGPAKRWPIDRVQAIDFSVMGAGGSSLTVRLSEDDPPPEMPAGLASLGLVGAVIGYVLRGQTLPTGALTLTQCVQLDLALSAEVARRKRVQAGEV